MELGSATVAPQPVQKRAPGDSRVPHATHAPVGTATGAPQPPQKRASGANCVPHATQATGRPVAECTAPTTSPFAIALTTLHAYSRYASQYVVARTVVYAEALPPHSGVAICAPFSASARHSSPPASRSVAPRRTTSRNASTRPSPAIRSPPKAPDRHAPRAVRSDPALKIRGGPSRHSGSEIDFPCRNSKR